MHGRLKVRSSEEQEAARRKEREKQVVTYRETMAKIFAKRAEGSTDKEALKLTEELLISNPDISTLWAIRREILASRLQTLSTDDGAQLCISELSLMERCLRVNPKSYGIWLHRRWTMEHTPSPQWGRERNLCDLFLQYDERNFHCWDYRRYVVCKAGISSSEEFSFTEEKIASNFSNYSAWHYRSKLLPSLHPSPEKPGGVAKDALKNEYELVQNAFYTDPSDQSAWFYHRWLLGKAERPLCFGCVCFFSEPSPTLCLSLNRPTMPSLKEPLTVSVGESPIVVIDQSDWPESQWVIALPELPSEKVNIAIKIGTAEASLWVEPGQQEYCRVWNVNRLLCPIPMDAPLTLLASEVQLCQDLLELEPENKWCLLSTLQLMEAVDPVRYHHEILSMFDKLLVVDSYRSGYYRDLKSRFIISSELRQKLELVQDDHRTLDLSGRGITRLYFTEHMAAYKELILDHNSISSPLHGLLHLRAVESLYLDHNQLECVPDEIAGSPCLKKLSIRHNGLKTIRDLSGLKGACLEEVQLQGNPVCEVEGVEEAVKILLPKLKSLNGKTI